ncbi:MAG: EamA family transporter [Planctomycetes bacterium]|nr:EamA family transporter [Planctomycetota bacterium]
MKLIHSSASGIVAVLLWATTVPVFKSIIENCDARAGVGVAFLGGGVLGLICMGKTLPSIFLHSKKHWCVQAFFFVVYEILLTVAIELTVNNQQAVEISILNYLFSVWILIFAVMMLRKTWDWRLPLGSILAIIGIGCATAADTQGGLMFAGLINNPIPYILALAASIFWALYSVRSGKHNNPLAAPLAAPLMCITGLVFILWSWATGNFVLNDVITWEILAMVIVTGVAYVLWEISLVHGNVIIVAAASYFTPILAVLFSWFYLDDVVLRWTLILGAALVIAGAFLCNAGVGTRKSDISHASHGE